MVVSLAIVCDIVLRLLKVKNNQKEKHVFHSKIRTVHREVIYIAVTQVDDDSSGILNLGMDAL